MSVEVGQLVGGAFGGALATSVLGPLVAQRRERRDVRAAVLRAIGDVERARWAPSSREDFRTTIIDLRTAALVAGTNRDAIDRYAYLAQVAQRMSEDTLEYAPVEHGGGSISAALSDLVRDMARLLTDIVWHPYRQRWAVRSGLRRLAREEQALRTDENEEDIPWNKATLF